MKLWTMQPLCVWEDIQRTGVYRCDPARSRMFPYLGECYAWLARKMAERVGPPPEGVAYPVWAWYKQDGRHKKPDLRNERWACGEEDTGFTCIALELPPERVLLSDFDIWHIILNDGLISDTEEEGRAQEAFYEALDGEQKRAYKDKNWERVFDVSTLDNGWTLRGDCVQATFWELKREDIRSVRFLRAGKYKRPRMGY